MLWAVALDVSMAGFSVCPGIFCPEFGNILIQVNSPPSTHKPDHAKCPQVKTSRNAIRAFYVGKMLSCNKNSLIYQVLTRQTRKLHFSLRVSAFLFVFLLTSRLGCLAVPAPNAMTSGGAGSPQDSRHKRFFSSEDVVN